MSENFEQSIIVCRDLGCLLISFCKRNYQAFLLIKVGIDGGGGFLKIYLSVFDMEYLISSSKVENIDLGKKGIQGTIDSLNSFFWDCLETKTSRKWAKHYNNVIHLPIKSDNLDNNTAVIEDLPPANFIC